MAVQGNTVTPYEAPSQSSTHSLGEDVKHGVKPFILEKKKSLFAEALLSDIWWHGVCQQRCSKTCPSGSGRDLEQNHSCGDEITDGRSKNPPPALA